MQGLFAQQDGYLRGRVAAQTYRLPLLLNDRTRRRYDGRTALIRASQTEAMLAGRDLDEDSAGSERLDGEFRVHRSRGDHLGFLGESLTAELIRRELGRLRPRR